IAPAGAVDVARLAARQQCLWRDAVGRTAGAGQLGGGQRTQIVARRQDRELAADGTDIGAVMDPDRTPRRDRLLPAGTARDKVVEAQVTELVAAVGGKYHIAERRGGEQRAQRFEPADEPAAALRRRLPPRAARRHDDDRRQRAAAAGKRDDDVARTG